MRKLKPGVDRRNGAIRSTRLPNKRKLHLKRLKQGSKRRQSRSGSKKSANNKKQPTEKLRNNKPPANAKRKLESSATS